MTNDRVDNYDGQLMTPVRVVLRICHIFQQESIKTSNPAQPKKRMYCARQTSIRNRGDHVKTSELAHPRRRQVSAIERMINRGENSSVATMCEERATHKYCVMDSEACQRLLVPFRQECRSCSPCPKYQDEVTNNCTLKTASVDTKSTIPDTKCRRPKKYFKSGKFDWIKALATFLILHLSACAALPTIQSSKKISTSLSVQLHMKDSNDVPVTPLSRRIRDSATHSPKTARRGRRLNRGLPEYLERHKAPQQLYNSHAGYFLEINKKGKVQGTLDGKSPYTKVQLLSTRTGHVAIFFVHSKRYLAMKAGRGKIYGAKSYNHKESEFREKMDDANRYFTYESALKDSYRKGKSRILSLRNRRAKRAKAINKYARFLKYARKTKGISR